MRLDRMTWHEAGAPGPAPLLVVPVGSTEQHGPHLPLGTDTLIATEVADRLVTRIQGAAVAPPVAIGASGEHADFPGTLSIGTDVLTSVLVEVGRSADWSSGLVFLNGHGGNVDALSRAEARLRSEGRHVLSWSPTWPRQTAEPSDLHAGRIETSLVLAIAPGLARPDDACSGPVVDISELRRHGVRAASPSGVLGDPTGASAEEGRELLAGFVDAAEAAVRAWLASRSARGG